MFFIFVSIEESMRGDQEKTAGLVCELFNLSG